MQNINKSEVIISDVQLKLNLYKENTLIVTSNIYSVFKLSNTFQTSWDTGNKRLKDCAKVHQDCTGLKCRTSILSYFSTVNTIVITEQLNSNERQFEASEAYTLNLV